MLAVKRGKHGSVTIPGVTEVASIGGFVRQGQVRLAYWLTSAPAQNLGIPCAAIAAYAIVAGLLSAFPPASNATGQLEFKVFGLEFSGPSGPITLWLMCFLGFILALKMLRV
jgi:hypothetical protein